MLKSTRGFTMAGIASVELLDGDYRRPQPEYFDRDWTEAYVLSDVYCPDPMDGSVE